MTPKQAYIHARDVIKERWLEDIIKNDPWSASHYALYVIKGRWVEGEDIIKTDPYSAYSYALDVIKERWLEGEDIIKTDPCWSYHYGRFIIKGRWLEGEDIIKNDPRWSYYYALYIIKGRLPENMHNSMLCHALKDSENEYVKEYFDLIKNKVEC